MKFFFLTLFILGWHNTFAATADSMQVETWITQARATARANNYEQAIEQNQQIIQALTVLHATPTHGKIAAAHSRIASCYYHLGRYRQAIAADSTALLMRKNLFGETAYPTGSSYNNLAADFRKLDWHQQALSVQLLALNTRLLHRGKSHLKTARCYENVAITYGFLREYRRSLDYYAEAEAIYQQQLPTDHPEIAGLYTNRAVTKYWMHRYEAALTDYLRAEHIYQSQPQLDRARFAQLSYNISSCYIKLGCQSDALTYLNRSLAIYNDISKNYHLGLGHCHENLAMIYQQQQDWERAIYHAEQALAIHGWKENFNAPEVASVYEMLAMLALERDLTGAALSYLDSAQWVMRTDGIVQDDNELSQLLDVELASDRAAVYWQLYERQQRVADLQRSFDYSTESIELFERYRQFNRSEVAKITDNKRLLPIFERGIKTAYELHELDPQTEYLDAVLNWMEQSKSVVLQTSLQQIRSALAENLPAAVVQREAEFEQQLSQLEKRRYEVNQTANDTVARHELQRQIFAVQEQFYQWRDELQRQYPAYFQIKYQSVDLDIASLQDALTSEQTLVEYFVGEAALYALVISKNSAQLKKWQPQQPLADLCLDFQRNIYHYNSSEKAGTNFAYTAFQLHQQLVAPIADLLSTRVIIVPDQQIGYVPFAALVAHLPEQPDQYRTYPYLLHQHQFSYAHSANLWLDLLRRETVTADKNLLAVAPAFASDSPIAMHTGQRAAMGVLKHNLSESTAVVERWGGDLLQQRQATKANFLQIAADYNFLHLATHGQANNVNGEFASLAFTDYSPDNLLYLREIYSLKLNTQLLVLSACETGTGPLRQGDGIISLARGFTYAGVQSILTTLWKINDRTSVQLMDYFYKNLLEKSPKDVALQRAQLQYIQQQPNQLAHPFYWAAYVPIGDMTAVQPSDALPFYPIAIIVGLLITSGLIYYWNKRSDSTELK